nr:MAG TPA: hypothetical protein [Caudoviricetes sp.]
MRKFLFCGTEVSQSLDICPQGVYTHLLWV